MRERLALAREALGSLKERVAALTTSQEAFFRQNLSMPFDVSMRLGPWLEKNGFEFCIDSKAMTRLHPERVRKVPQTRRVSARTPQEDREWARKASHLRSVYRGR